MTKIYGPYTRKDGRSHVIIVNEDKRRTQSYPRYLMEQHLGRALLDAETVDHIDNDFTNNALDNLQLLSIADNVKKSAKPITWVDLVCVNCGKQFRRRLSQEKHNITLRMYGPYCSRRCNGLQNH